jgi:ferric-dicitrate binding protein FerR (iron transport regulator)
MDHSFDIDRILLKYIREEALSQEETVLLQEWLQAGEGREEMIQQFKNETDWVQDGLKQMQQTANGRIWDKLSSRIEGEGYWPTGSTGSTTVAPVIPLPRPHRAWWRYLAAATVLFAVAGSAFWILQQRSAAVPGKPAPVAAATDARPGGNRAILTLSNGQQINLDSTGNGVLAAQGNMNVTKLADGQLAYNKTSDEKPTAPAFNVLSTPRAGQFSLTLPDGSRAWLNNASSLRYPVAFTGVSREVELSGEAYFEIAKDASHPFRVAIRRGAVSSTVEVLGTSFNIMAYDDENAERTTLVEGSVRFIHAGASALLKPEEQSVLDASGALKTQHHVNVAEITAWKNGYFHFDHASLETTMRQLARWYDVDVDYAGNIPAQEFMGKIQRNLPLSAVLKGLENEHIHFSLEGRKLMVKP